MNSTRALTRSVLIALLALPLASACDDQQDTPSGSAGAPGSAGTSGRATSDAGSSGGSGDLGCPLELPRTGEPCQTRPGMLCVWKGKGGPCPPDPDKLWVCSATTGKWVAAAPAIDCDAKQRPRPDAGDDAGQDAGL